MKVRTELEPITSFNNSAVEIFPRYYKWLFAISWPLWSNNSEFLLNFEFSNADELQTILKLSFSYENYDSISYISYHSTLQGDLKLEINYFEQLHVFLPVEIQKLNKFSLYSYNCFFGFIANKMANAIFRTKCRRCKHTPLLKGRQNLDLEQWCRLWQEFFPCIWCTLPKIVNSVKEYSVQEYSKNEINTENNIQDLRREFFLYINIFIRYEWLWILIFGKFLFIKIKFSNHSFNSLLYG